MQQRIGMIGLGKIGMPIARYLIERGHTVIGYRRHRIEEFAALGGIPALSSADVARQSDVVLSCLPDDAALDEVVSGAHGLVHGVRLGQVVAEISMLSLAAKERARQQLDHTGAVLLDCPISGTPPMVPARKTVFFASGEPRAYEQARPIFEAITDTIFYLGAFGAGSKMKCVANLLVAIHNLAAAEAMVLATQAGLDLEQVIAVIKPSIANSGSFAARAPLMAQQRYAPPTGTIAQVQEFIGTIHDFARSVGSPTPLLDAAERFYDRGIAGGRGDLDVAALYTVLGEQVALPGDDLQQAVAKE